MCVIYEDRSDKVKSVQFSMTSSEEQATSTQRSLQERSTNLHALELVQKKDYDTSPFPPQTEPQNPRHQ